MKNKIKKIIAVSLVISVCSSSNLLQKCTGVNNIVCADAKTEANNAIIKFQDINLEKAIRAAINKSKGNMGFYPMGASTAYNYVSDITPLKGLVNLKELNLSGNNLQVINTIGNLSNYKLLIFHTQRLKL